MMFLCIAPMLQRHFQIQTHIILEVALSGVRHVPYFPASTKAMAERSSFTHSVFQAPLAFFSSPERREYDESRASNYSDLGSSKTLDTIRLLHEL